MRNVITLFSFPSKLALITTGPSSRPVTPSICEAHRRKAHSGTADAPSANAERALENFPAR